MKAWLADPMAVLSGRVFDANIFHPAEGALTYSDHLLLQSLVMTPLYAVTGNLVLCYNVLLLLSIAASGLAMHVLVRSVTGSTAAAFVAGLAWACWPYRTAHLLHLQLQSLYFLPLALLGAPPRGRRAPLAGCDVARGVRGAAGDLVGLLRRDDGDRGRGGRRRRWRSTTGQWRSARAVVAAGGERGDRRAADCADRVAVLADAAARRVWPQPVRSGRARGVGARATRRCRPTTCCTGEPA